jgi:hypothetical protein
MVALCIYIAVLEIAVEGGYLDTLSSTIHRGQVSKAENLTGGNSDLDVLPSWFRSYAVFHEQQLALPTADTKYLGKHHMDDGCHLLHDFTPPLPLFNTLSQYNLTEH